ncbi:G-type lectin S-receptor-like serine/threonine-protein kinase At1g61490 [Zingiber officinale]|uniref:G-type lectin S-receptor-like serine/threonine-protein kinase At1g61490 n=1 Tax=Zingiber officinale TaxID=94328 RepID=UPI001C4C7EFB|nr:G-type lectin S-receptor-like serine/threonine-protein kinase At1g61490 [Zingiber officinale]
MMGWPTPPHQMASPPLADSLCHGKTRGKKNSTGRRVFSLKELQSATNNFNYDNKIGEGGFGSVYWGQLWDGSQIAVKRLKVWSNKAELEFAVEVEEELKRMVLVALACTQSMPEKRPTMTEVVDLLKGIPLMIASVSYPKKRILEQTQLQSYLFINRNVFQNIFNMQSFNQKKQQHFGKRVRLKKLLQLQGSDIHKSDIHRNLLEILRMEME